MSASPPQRGLAARLPPWLRPLPRERRGTGQLRLVETTLLVLAGLLLAIATVNDVVHQTHVNHRLTADLATWRAATQRNYHNITLEQDIKAHTTREVACGNVSPGAPDERAQLCLTLAGRTIDGRRYVTGGYYVPAKAVDVRAHRYACFGTAAHAGLCGLGKPPAGSPPAPPIRLGRP